MTSTARRAVSAAVLTLLCGTAGAQTVYRCQVGGDLRFQQVPCDGSTPTVGEDLRRKKDAALTRQNETGPARTEQERRARILAAPASMLSPVEIAERDLWRAEAATKALNDRVRDGTFDRMFKANMDKHCGGRLYPKLQVGLTEPQVLNCTEYRVPEAVNVTTTSGGESKQLVFNRFGKREYLYFRNGILTGFQQ